MEKQLARIVNKGLAGEPENVVFQVKENLQCVEFSQIKFITIYLIATKPRPVTPPNN
jgi:hypothetical protein